MFALVCVSIAVGGCKESLSSLTSECRWYTGVFIKERFGKPPDVFVKVSSPTLVVLK